MVGQAALARLPDPFRLRVSVRVFRGSLFRRSACAKDLIGCAENLLCALFRDRLGVETDCFIQPILYVSPCVVRAFQAKRFTAKQGDCFRFDFANIPGRLFCVGEIAFGRVKDHVGHFVKEGLMRELRHGVDRDLTATGKPLTVAVRLVESDPLNGKRLKCSLGFPFRDRDWSKIAAVGLTEYKPSGAVNKRRESLFFGSFVVGLFIVAALSR